MNLRDQIENTLRQYPDGQTITELSEKMNWDDTANLEHSLNKMSYKGKVNKTKDNKWKVS